MQLASRFANHSPVLRSENPLSDARSSLPRRPARPGLEPADATALPLRCRDEARARLGSRTVALVRPGAPARAGCGAGLHTRPALLEQRWRAGAIACGLISWSPCAPCLRWWPPQGR